MVSLELVCAKSFWQAVIFFIDPNSIKEEKKCL